MNNTLRCPILSLLNIKILITWGVAVNSSGGVWSDGPRRWWKMVRSPFFLAAAVRALLPFYFSCRDRVAFSFFLCAHVHLCLALVCISTSTTYTPTFLFKTTKMMPFPYLSAPFWTSPPLSFLHNRQAAEQPTNASLLLFPPTPTHQHPKNHGRRGRRRRGRAQQQQQHHHRRHARQHFTERRGRPLCGCRP